MPEALCIREKAVRFAITLSAIETRQRDEFLPQLKSDADLTASFTWACNHRQELVRVRRNP